MVLQKDGFNVLLQDLLIADDLIHLIYSLNGTIFVRFSPIQLFFMMLDNIYQLLIVKIIMLRYKPIDFAVIPELSQLAQRPQNRKYLLIHFINYSWLRKPYPSGKIDFQKNLLIFACSLESYCSKRIQVC